MHEFKCYDDPSIGSFHPILGPCCGLGSCSGSTVRHDEVWELMLGAMFPLAGYLEGWLDKTFGVFSTLIAGIIMAAEFCCYSQVTLYLLRLSNTAYDPEWEKASFIVPAGILVLSICFVGLELFEKHKENKL